MWRRFGLQPDSLSGASVTRDGREATANLKICQVCNGLQVDEHTLPQAVSAFEATKNAGCAKCGLILDAIEEYKGGWIESHRDEGYIRLTKAPGSGIFRVGLLPDRRDRFLTNLGDEHDQFEIWQYDERTTGANWSAPFHSSLDIVYNTNSPGGLRCASNWLQDCLRNHHHCSKEASPKFTPLRILDVGPLDENELDLERVERERRPRSSWGSNVHPDTSRVRLIESRDIFVKSTGNSIQYAALSYCWGNDLEPVTMTTKENLAAYTSEIAIDTLPKTIQDAITVCRRLRIRYLWVDSLCIVQNDDQEWRRQASQMRYIYSNSQVTIAAHHAASCKDGFLGKQLCGNPKWQKAFVTPNYHKKLFVRKFETLNWSPTPLMKRGWTLQECILPQRLLHFTGREMAWECSTGNFCECGQGHPFETPVKVKTRLGRTSEPTSTVPKGSSSWMELIEEYSSRELSHGSDKLVALSGLMLTIEIEEVKYAAGSSLRDRLHKTAYLAGLMRADLARHLLWYADGRRQNTNTMVPAPRGPLQWRAPTWSWASIDTPVRYPRHGNEVNAVVYHSDTFCTPKDDFHPTGSVIDGQILIKGLMVPVQLTTVEGEGKSFKNWGSSNWSGRTSIVRTRNGDCFEVALDVPLQVEMRPGDAAFDCWDSGKCPLASETVSDLNKNECDMCHFKMESNPTIWCLKIASDGYGTRDSFLVVERADMREGLAWNRIGMGVTNRKREEDASSLFWGARNEIIRII